MTLGELYGKWHEVAQAHQDQAKTSKSDTTRQGVAPPLTPRTLAERDFAVPTVTWQELLARWHEDHADDPNAEDYFPKLNMFASLLKLGGCALQVNVGMEYDQQIFRDRDRLWSQPSEKLSYVEKQQNELGDAISTMYTYWAMRTYLVGTAENIFDDGFARGQAQEKAFAEGKVSTKPSAEDAKTAYRDTGSHRVSVLCYYIGDIARHPPQTTLSQLPNTFFWKTELPIIVRTLRETGKPYQLCVLYDGSANDAEHLSQKSRAEMCDSIQELLAGRILEIANADVPIIIKVLNTKSTAGLIDVTRERLLRELHNDDRIVNKDDIILPFTPERVRSSRVKAAWGRYQTIIKQLTRRTPGVDVKPISKIQTRPVGGPSEKKLESPKKREAIRWRKPSVHSDDKKEVKARNAEMQRALAEASAPAVAEAKGGGRRRSRRKNRGSKSKRIRRQKRTRGRRQRARKKTRRKRRSLKR